jgi:hypothetical protein
VLARKQPALEIAGQAVGAVGRLEVDGGALLSGHVFHAAVVVDVGEQEVTALLPPQRPLRRPERAAESGGQLLDRLARRDDLVELGRELLDALVRLRRCARARPGRSAGGRGHRQHVPA